MRSFFAIVLILLSAIPAAAAPKERITLYLDGAYVERELSAANGTLEFRLPPAFITGSLRVAPMGAALVKRVELLQNKPDKKRERETASLMERRAILEDRLKALETREEIFRAAARSQSARAPRKTKTNPEPLENVRQGTDFALSKLEGVYTARRRAEKELKSLDARLELLKKTGTTVGMLKVWVSPAAARVRLSYLVSDMCWTPLYDFRVNSAASVGAALYAELPAVARDAALCVIPSSLKDGASAASFPISTPEKPAKVFSRTFAAEKIVFSPAILPAISFSFTNGDTPLPAGQASCFLNGEYLGRVSFNGALPGEKKTISMGK